MTRKASADPAPELCHYRQDNGTRVALVEPHPRRKNHLRIVVLDAPMMLKVIPATERRWMTEITTTTRAKARKTWRHAARTFGADKRARDLVYRY